MHSLAGGRYGYKVRRHTDTTFATIATVGADGESVVEQGYVLHVRQSCSPGNFRDEFNALTYDGSDGTLSWTGNWTEVGETDGPGAGDFRVLNSAYCATGNCLQIREDRASSRRLRRQVDLSGARSATLSISYRRRVVASPVGGTVTLDISDNGGASFTPLKIYLLDAADPVHTVDTFDITSYMAPDTQIRFSTDDNIFLTALYVDDVDILTGCDSSGLLTALRCVRCIQPERPGRRHQSADGELGLYASRSFRTMHPRANSIPPRPWPRLPTFPKKSTAQPWVRSCARPPWASSSKK